MLILGVLCVVLVAGVVIMAVAFGVLAYLIVRRLPKSDYVTGREFGYDMMQAMERGENKAAQRAAHMVPDGVTPWTAPTITPVEPPPDDMNKPVPLDE